MLLSDHAAAVVQDAVKGASGPAASRLATIGGIVVLLVGASGVFGELHEALNSIWGVKLKPNRGFRNFGWCPAARALFLTEPQTR